MKISIDPSDAIHGIIQPHFAFALGEHAPRGPVGGSRLGPCIFDAGCLCCFLKGANGVARARINSPRAMTTLLPELPRVVLLVRGVSQARVVRRG